MVENQNAWQVKECDFLRFFNIHSLQICWLFRVSDVVYCHQEVSGGASAPENQILFEVALDFL